MTNISHTEDVYTIHESDSKDELIKAIAEKEKMLKELVAIEDDDNIHEKVSIKKETLEVLNFLLRQKSWHKRLRYHVKVFWSTLWLGDITINEFTGKIVNIETPSGLRSFLQEFILVLANILKTEMAIGAILVFLSIWLTTYIFSTPVVDYTDCKTTSGGERCIYYYK